MYLYLIIIIISIIYIINYRTTLTTIKNKYNNISKDTLIAVSILPVFCEINDSSEEYIRLIEYLSSISKSKNLYRRNKLSIKIHQLSPHKHLLWDRVLTIVNFAKNKNIFVWISALVSSTLDIEYKFYIRLLRMGYTNIGLTLAAYNYTIERKIDSILRLGGSIRLVKGIYKGSIDDKLIVDELYYNSAVKLINSGYYHAIATHDFKILKRLYYYQHDYTKFIELAFFHNSYNYVNYMLADMPFKPHLKSFYMWYGDFYPYLRDNIPLFSYNSILNNISYIWNSVKYTTIAAYKKTLIRIT